MSQILIKIVKRKFFFICFPQVGQQYEQVLQDWQGTLRVQPSSGVGAGSELRCPKEFRAPPLTRGGGGTVASEGPWKICPHPAPEHHFGMVFFSQLLQGPGYREFLFKNKAKQNQPTNQTTTTGTHTLHKDFGILAVNSAELISELLQNVPEELCSWCREEQHYWILLPQHRSVLLLLNRDFVGFLLTYVTVWRRGRLVF